MEVKQVEKQKTIMVRFISPVSELSGKMGELYPAIAAYMQENGIAFAGAPYAMYYNMDMEALDVEIGFPVASDFSGNEKFKSSELPAGKVLSEMHIGPYQNMELTYNKMMAYLKENKIVPANRSYEIYLNSPMEVKPEELETEIRFILQ